MFNLDVYGLAQVEKGSRKQFLCGQMKKVKNVPA